MYRDTDDITVDEGADVALLDRAMVDTRMAVCITDPSQADNPIVYVNDAFERMTGYGPDRALGRNCRFLQGKNTHPDTVQDIRRAVARRDTCIVEILNYRADGTPFWNALHLAPIYDRNGALQYYFGSQWDVTGIHRSREDADVPVKTWLSERMRRAAERLRRAPAAARRAPPARNVDPENLIDIVLSSYAPAPESYSKSGETVELNPAAISLLGMGLHELSRGAHYWGAWAPHQMERAGKIGEVDIDWSRGRGGMVLNWTERAAQDPERQILPSPWLNRLLAQGRAKMTVKAEDDRLHAQLVLPQD